MGAGGEGQDWSVGLWKERSEESQELEGRGACMSSGVSDSSGLDCRSLGVNTPDAGFADSGLGDSDLRGFGCDGTCAPRL